MIDQNNRPKPNGAKLNEQAAKLMEILSAPDSVFASKLKDAIGSKEYAELERQKEAAEHGREAMQTATIAARAAQARGASTIIPGPSIGYLIERAGKDATRQAQQAKDSGDPLFPDPDMPIGRDGLEEGEYAVYLKIRLIGTVKVGADYDQRVVAKADPWKLLAVALSKLNNVTIASLVREAEALTVDEGTDKRIKKEAAVAIDALKESTVTRMRGKVTTDLHCFHLED